MADIGSNYNSGGKDAQPGQGNPNDLKAALQAAVDDLAAIRAAFVALTAKLDGDAGITDVDYASTLDPAANTLTKS